MMRFKFAPVLAALALLAAIHSSFALLKVQIVNDSGLPDSEVFLLLTGQPLNAAENKGPIKVTGIGVANSTGGVKNDPPATSKPVSVLPNTGEKLTSKFSGRVLPIYEFSIETLGSGVLYVSYKTPLSWVSAAPTAHDKLRFDKLELTYDAAIVSVANLTSIDFFGIPLQLENFSRALEKLTLKRTHTFYASTPTLLSKFAALGASSAFLSTSGAPWVPSRDFSTFARVIAPGQFSSASATGSPAPYPSFDGYLQSLLKANYTFTEKGFANNSHYDYTGKIESDGEGGYMIRLKGTTTPPPPSPLPGNSEIVLPLPNGRVPGAKPAQNFDHYIYGAVLNPDSIVLPGSGLSAEQSLATVPNSVYGWIAADVFSGLNFGYLGGKYGDDIATWYAVAPTCFPFGGARKVNDGFYNSWAATIYNNSDSYGFAFSDRSGPSPGMPLGWSDTLRITILPDLRLDAPMVTAVPPASAPQSTIAVQWQTVPGATGYTLEVTPPFPPKVMNVSNVPGPKQGAQISGLRAGTPYTISVVANGKLGGKSVQSAVVPIRVSTPGQATPVRGNVPFVLGFNWGNPVKGSVVTVNGEQLPKNDGGSVQMLGKSGINNFVVTITDEKKKVIFQNTLLVNFKGPPAGYRIDQPFYLISNQTELSQAGPPDTPPYSLQKPVTVGIPFVPLAEKQTFPVAVPIAAPVTPPAAAAPMTP
jgi:hypothetical protein